MTCVDINNTCACVRESNILEIFFLLPNFIFKLSRERVNALYSKC